MLNVINEDNLKELNLKQIGMDRRQTNRTSYECQGREKYRS